MVREISRADPDFNVDTAKLCSRHFKDGCFRAHGRYYYLKAHVYTPEHINITLSINLRSYLL